MSLGKPDAGEESYFKPVAVDDVTIWFTNDVKAEEGGQTIQIDASKVLFSYDLQVNSAKQYIEKG